VYNLTVLRIHNYAVGEFGLLVHNGCSKPKPTGSYTNTHQTGKVYHGKGGTARSQVSGRTIADATGDPHIATQHTPAVNSREAFKAEAGRLAQDGGPNPDKNYNKRNSPGVKYIAEDGK